MRPFVLKGLHSIGIIRLGYAITLAAAAAVAGLLIVEPGVLARYLPDWRHGVGFVLLAASCIGMSTALARMLRASMFLVIWSFVSLTLASEIVFHKLPHKLAKDDILELKSYLPEGVVDDAHGGISSLSRIGSLVLKSIQGAYGGSYSVENAGLGDLDNAPSSDKPQKMTDA